MNTPADHYLDRQTYDALLRALANVKPDLATGKVEPHCFVEVLGEIGGIWPDTVLDDEDDDESGD